MMKLICILVMIVVTFEASDACCCSLWIKHGNCGCNLFNCNCNYANDDFCYYSPKYGAETGGYCRLPVCRSSERCSALTEHNMSKNNSSSMNDPMVIYTTLDINRDGHISADEFGNSANYLKQFANYGSSNETTVHLKNIFQTLDLNNNGKIEPIEIDNSLEGLMGHSFRNEGNYKQGNIESWNRNDIEEDLLPFNPTRIIRSTEEFGLNVCFEVITNTKAWGNEVHWNIKGASTNATCLDMANEGHFDSYTWDRQICCLPTLESEYIITCKDTYGDGWHLGYLEILGNKYCENFTHGNEMIDVMRNPAKEDCEIVEDSKWKANVESVFEFNSQELSGDKNADGTFSYPNLNSGIKLKAQVKVQSFADHTLRVQINRIRFYTAGRPISLMNAHEVLGEGEVAFSARSHGVSEFKRFLEEPMMFSEKRWLLKNLVVSMNEPECVTKIKKSLMAELEKPSASRGLTLLKKQAIMNPLQIPSQPKKIDV